MVYGPPHIVMGPWDHFLMLDEAWRIQSGQVPHTDFYNPIGPLTYQLVAAGVALGHANIAAISYSTILFALLVLPCAAIVAFTRLPQALAGLMVIFLAVQALAVRPLGFTENEASYAMLYNRQGWILLSVILMQTCIPIALKNKSSGYLDEAIAGLLLGLLFFCKISFFVVACGAIAVRVIWRESLEVEKSIILIAAFLSVVALFATMAWVGPVAYLHDISMAIAAQDTTSRLNEMKTFILAGKIPLAGFALIGLLSIASARLAKAPWQTYAQIFATGALFVGATLLISAGNAGESSGRDLPLLLLGTIVVATVLWKLPVTRSGLPGVLITSMLALGVVIFMLPTMTRDLFSLVGLLQGKGGATAVSSNVVAFKDKQLEGFLIRSDVMWKSVFTMSDQVPKWVDDGLQLLNGKVEQQSRLAVLGYGDAFSSTLGLKPARGMPIWLVPNVSFNTRSHPPSEIVLGNADYVMVPSPSPSDEGCCHEFVEAIMNIYGSYLRQNFSQIGTSDHWVLHSRNKNSGPSTTDPR